MTMITGCSGLHTIPCLQKLQHPPSQHSTLSLQLSVAGSCIHTAQQKREGSAAKRVFPEYLHKLELTSCMLKTTLQNLCPQILTDQPCSYQASP